MMQPPFLSFVTILYTFAVQEKVDSLNEKLERESFVGDKQSCDFTDFDNSSSKSVSKPKCEYWMNDTIYSHSKCTCVSRSSQHSKSHSHNKELQNVQTKGRTVQILPCISKIPS